MDLVVEMDRSRPSYVPELVFEFFIFIFISLVYNVEQHIKTN